MLPAVNPEDVNKAISARATGYRVSIIVPSVAPDGHKFNHTQLVDNVAAALADLFGGATLSTGFGVWLDDNNAIVAEHTTEVWSLVAGTFSHNEVLNHVVTIALAVKHVSHNDCVLWSVQNVNDWGLA